MDRLLAGRSVLVVEDEVLILIMIEDMLADLGCEAVSAAGTVDKALALLDERRFDAAMLDMNLNGADSHSVADALAARGVPFAYSTGGHITRPGDRARPVLRKPFRQKELTETMTRLLAPC